MAGRECDLKQAEVKVEEAQHLSSEAAKLRDEMRLAMDKAISEKIALKIQADERKDHNSTITHENINLKGKIAELEEDQKKCRK